MEKRKEGCDRGVQEGEDPIFQLCCRERKYVIDISKVPSHETREEG